MNWRTSRRETGLVEHACEHGVGHPNRGSALWLAEAFEDEDDVACGYAARLLHGCCGYGCCARDDFPGTLFASMRHAHRLIREFNHNLRETALELHDVTTDALKEEAWERLPWWRRAWYRFTYRRPR